MPEQIESAGTSTVVVEEEQGSGHVDVSNRKCDATGVEPAITLEDPTFSNFKFLLCLIYKFISVHWLR